MLSTQVRSPTNASSDRRIRLFIRERGVCESGYGSWVNLDWSLARINFGFRGQEICKRVFDKECEDCTTYSWVQRGKPGSSGVEEGGREDWMARPSQSFR